MRDRVIDKSDDIEVVSSESMLNETIERLNYIISLLPNEYRDLIEQGFLHKRIPKEYTLSSILYAISTATGLTFFVKGLGYKNYGNCYHTIIGSRGDAKTEAIKLAIRPIKEMDDRDYDDHLDELESYEEEEPPPVRKQMLIQNASIEAAYKIHSENPNAIGISMDEIYGLIEKMSSSSSRDGKEWRNFFLEGYTNGHIDISRKTTDSYRIKETYPTLIGGLQHQFLPFLFAHGNLESGFIDRLLFTPKLTHSNKLTLGDVDSEVLDMYASSIKNVLAYKRQSERPEETNKQFEITMSPQAEDRLFRYTQELIVRQSKAQSIIKEYMSKMQISIQKLCINVFIMKHAANSTFGTVMGADIVHLAIQLNEFYFLNFQMLFEQGLKSKNVLPKVEDVIQLAVKNKASQKAVAEITGLNKSTISKKWPKN